jgi:chromate transporter
MDGMGAKNARTGIWPIFLIFLRLGLTSFGGPIAHLGYFRDEFVVRRRWLSDSAYADLVALCQFLPGASSSQVGMAVGLTRGGMAGALAAWVGFTLPSTLLLALFAQSLVTWGAFLPVSVLHGLKIAAVAVVAQAVWGMARSLCTDTARITFAIVAACVLLVSSNVVLQVGILAVAALAGALIFKPGPAATHEPMPLSISRRTGASMLILFAVLLVGLPVLAVSIQNQTLAVASAFYRAGALVFGGGHVVLPLLQSAVVPSGWVPNDTFLAGYGAAQAVPGPLFTFAAFLGMAMNGWTGVLICIGAIFAPSFLLVTGALPFWERSRGGGSVRAAMAGVNAAVVGILLATLYDPVWTSAIKSGHDFGLAVVAFAALSFWRVPPWLVVLAASLVGWSLG